MVILKYVFIRLKLEKDLSKLQLVAGMLLNIWITFKSSGIISRTPLECNLGINSSVQLFPSRYFLKSWWSASRKDDNWSIAAASISTTSTSENFSYLALEPLETSFVYTSALLVLLLFSTVVFNEHEMGLKLFSTRLPSLREDDLIVAINIYTTFWAHNFPRISSKCSFVFSSPRSIVNNSEN